MLPYFDIGCIFTLQNPYFYTNIKGDALYTVTGFLFLIKYIYTDKKLYPFFTKFNHVFNYFVDTDVTNTITALLLLLLYRTVTLPVVCMGVKLGR